VAQVVVELLALAAIDRGVVEREQRELGRAR
jgi:hypothetical protein